MHKIASSALLLALLGLTALLPVTESLISTPHAPLHLRVTAFSAARCAPSSWSQLGQSTLVGGRPAVLGLWQPRSRAAVVRAAADSDSSPSLESLGLPRDVREQVQGLSDDERNSLLAMVGLKAPFVPGTGGRKRERPRREPKPKETSSGRRQRRQVSEAKKKFEEAGGISPVVERRRGEKGADKTQVKDGAARAGVPSSPEPAQAKKGREDAVLQTAGQARAEWLEKDGEEEDEDFDEDDEDDEDEEDEEGGGLRSEEARFFGDALPSERTAKDKSFLDSIFGDSLGKEPAAWSDEEEDEDSEEGDEGADAAADGEDDDDDFSFLGPKRERAVMERLRLDALAGVGGARQGEAGAVRGQMEFPDVQTIDPYNPQTFGYTLVGAVLGAHGVRGEIKVTSQGMSDFAAERISRGWQLFLQMPGRRSPRPRRCVLARPGAKALQRIVKLKGTSSREEAAALRGARVFVRDADIRRADALEAAGAEEGGDTEYFVEDLVGLRVLLPGENMRVLGTIVGVVTRDQTCAPGLEAFGQDLLEIRFGDPATETVIEATALVLLVPLVPALCPVVDIAAGFMHLCPPIGLLELAALPPKAEVVIKGLLPAAGTSTYWAKLAAGLVDVSLQS